MLARVECESLLSLAYLTSKLAFNSCSQTTLSLAYLPARLCIKSGLLSKMQSIFGSPKNQRFLILSTPCCQKSLSFFKFLFDFLYVILFNFILYLTFADYLIINFNAFLRWNIPAEFFDLEICVVLQGFMQLPVPQ